MTSAPTPTTWRRWSRRSAHPGVVVSAGANASCVRVAAERPQLIEAVVLASSVVELQFQRREMDSIAASESVLEAGLKQLRVDPVRCSGR